MIQSLWIGNSLSIMEKLCIDSFLQHGHEFQLYVYNDVKGVPEGTLIKDANEILSANKIFKYKKHNSYAGFSNLFRYKMLLEKGNYWVDMDMVCLSQLVGDQEYCFAAQRNPEKNNKLKTGIWNRSRKKLLNFLPKHVSKEKTVKVNTCLIKAPKNSAMIEYCYNEAAKLNSDDLKWGQTGPDLFTEAVKKFDMWHYVANPEVFCPVNWLDWEEIISESPGEGLLANTQAIHLWNEMWRRNNVDKTGSFSESCIYEQLKKVYLRK